MSRLTRDGTAGPVSRDQILRRVGDMEIFIFLVQLTASRIGNPTRLMHNLLDVLTTHHIRAHLFPHPQAVSVSEACIP